MPGNGKRIFSALAVTGLTIALLLAGQYTWHKTQIEKPLTMGFKQVGAVKDWDIQYDPDKTKVSVTLKGKADLQETYLALTGVLDKTLGAGKYNLEVRNNPSRKLADFYQRIQPVLYEGLSTGRYTWLVREIDAEAKKDGLEARVQFDHRLLYLQLAEQDQAMYKLIPRENGGNQVLASGTAGLGN